MSADLNLIANQANSPLMNYRESAEATPRRLRHRFSGLPRPRRESASFEGGTILLKNYNSTFDRRVPLSATPVSLNESARLTNPPGWSSALVKSANELGGDVIKIIGENGLRRFEQFKKYGEGWEFGTGKPLSSHSVESFKRFCERFSEPVPNEPSLFLTREGNLQLGWEDREANKIEFEFFPDKIEYYIEALDDEGAVDLTDISQLFDKLKSIIE